MFIRSDLLDWQWQGYARAHGDRTNLLLHLATVPLFWIGGLLLVGAVVSGNAMLALGLPVLWLVALVAQAKGHRLEANAAAPFLGTTDFVARLLVEQFVSFPRYVLSGAFFRALATTR